MAVSHAHVHSGQAVEVNKLKQAQEKDNIGQQM